MAAPAFACGFVSESHGNKAFRAASGKPPGRDRADLHRARQSQACVGTWLDVYAGWTNHLC